MDEKSKLLWEAKNQLNDIIKNLEQISTGVRRNFKGIGENNCADAIDRKVSQYRKALKRLESINVDNYIDGFGEVK